MTSKRNQSGFALLLFMVVMLGIGGIALTGVMQSVSSEVELKKFKDNNDVLNRAKQALLMYAYKYPQFNDDGPGRLPCPYDEVGGYSGALSDAICNAVGRLPVNNLDLDFFDATDSSNEDLWYAVSDNFYNFNPGGGSVVNSDTVGSITLFDQTGNLLYDGAIDGIAAIIIAPGPAISRDENNDGDYEYLQVRDTNAEKKDPRNYLDTFNGFDNSVFLNGGNGAANGFMLGPVRDINTNTFVINDQMIIITSDEMIAMSEKAVLEFYRQAINQYQTNIWNTTVNDYRYPWLNSYPEITGLQIYNPGQNTVGRIPSFFTNYFTDNDSGSVVSNIAINYDVSIVIDESSVNDMDVAFDNTYNENGGSIVGRSNLAFNQTNTGQLSGVGVVGNTVSSTFAGPTIYFWDDQATPDGWEICTTPPVAGDHRDCHRNGSGGFVADPLNDANMVDIRIRQVTLKLGFDLDFTLGFDYTSMPDPTYTPPTVTTHAAVNADFSGIANDVTVDNGIGYFSFILDDDYDAGEVTFTPVSSGNFSADPGTLITFTDFDITLDYFPELPSWAAEAENNWNSSIMMGFANGYAPGGLGNCTVGTDCLTVNNFGGVIDDKIAILVIAGDIPANVADLVNIFEGENNEPLLLNGIFDKNPPLSNDFIMVLQ